MAQTAKKEKKYKGGQSGRKSHLRSIASTSDQRPGVQYKYGDYDPRDVHEGTATLGAYDFTDDPGTLISSYGRAVKTGHGKSAFRFQGKLYKTTNSSGTTSEEVKV